MIKIKLILLMSLIILAGCNNENKVAPSVPTNGELVDKLTLGREYAVSQLKYAQNDSANHNVIKLNKALIKDSLTAVAVIEPLLFSTYGKQAILNQRPYEIYHIGNYWVIMGRIQKGWDGGTFLVIIDDRNAKIIRLTHGK